MLILLFGCRHVLFARLPCHQCVSALLNSSAPFPPTSFSLLLEFRIYFIFGSGGGKQQNGSNFSKKENGASQPTLHSPSPSHPQWPSSTLCYQSAVSQTYSSSPAIWYSGYCVNIHELEERCIFFLNVDISPQNNKPEYTGENKINKN